MKPNIEEYNLFDQIQLPRSQSEYSYSKKVRQEMRWNKAIDGFLNQIPG
jgi:hypothetical protein